MRWYGGAPLAAERHDIVPRSSVIDQAVDQTMALLLWAKDANGEDDVALFTGTLRRRGAGYVLELGDDPPLDLPGPWLQRIRPTTPKIEDVVEGARFVLSLSVRDAKEAPGPLRRLGLSWPSDPA